MMGASLEHRHMKLAVLHPRCRSSHHSVSTANMCTSINCKMYLSCIAPHTTISRTKHILNNAGNVVIWMKENQRKEGSWSSSKGKNPMSKYWNLINMHNRKLVLFRLTWDGMTGVLRMERGGDVILLDEVQGQGTEGQSSAQGCWWSSLVWEINHQTRLANVVNDSPSSEAFKTQTKCFWKGTANVMLDEPKTEELCAFPAAC